MQSIEQAADLLTAHEAPVALTGAGMSKASGIPTYRGADDGLWREAGIREWATREAFEADPAVWYANFFWGFYDMRHAASPSSAHYALKDMVEASIIEGIVTQNIDGLDRRAGTAADRVLEVHGNDRGLSCTRVGECDFTVATEDWLESHDKASMPVCPEDGSPLKPDIILFNDDGGTVPERVAQDWHRAWGVIGGSGVLMVVGTTLAVPTWAEAVADSVAEDVPLIVVNPEPTPADKIASVVVHERAEDALPGIRDLILG